MRCARAWRDASRSTITRRAHRPCASRWTRRSPPRRTRRNISRNTTSRSARWRPSRRKRRRRSPTSTTRRACSPRLSRAENMLDSAGDGGGAARGGPAARPKKRGRRPRPDGALPHLCRGRVPHPGGAQQRAERPPRCAPRRPTTSGCTRRSTTARTCSSAPKGKPVPDEVLLAAARDLRLFFGRKGERQDPRRLLRAAVRQKAVRREGGLRDYTDYRTLLVDPRPPCRRRSADLHAPIMRRIVLCKTRKITLIYGKEAAATRSAAAFLFDHQRLFLRKSSIRTEPPRFAARAGAKGVDGHAHQEIAAQRERETFRRRTRSLRTRRRGEAP